jgi:ABC-type sugar transport system substrate-binding protein
MKRFRFLLSLTTKDNDYQAEQAAVAERAARQLGVDLEIIYADNDAINQSQQLLRIIQSASATRPDAMILEPVGTGMPQVARAAVAAGIGWVVLNRDVDYVGEIRQAHSLPIFAISSDHLEVGRIQGRQFAALLPEGGQILYIQGPSTSDAAHQRTAGMLETKPDNIQVKTLVGHWTEAKAHQAVSSWLRLPTSKELHIGVVGCQNDVMAMGARKAFEEVANEAERSRWLALPFTGCDGLQATGQTWVRQGLLAATINIPANAGQAMELLLKAFHGPEPPERTLTVPLSFPAVAALASRAVVK